MELTLTPQAWIAAGCLVGVVVMTGLVLWNAWRTGRQPLKRNDINLPSFTRSWEQEDARLAELARLAEQLRNKPK
jgi:hypothetical protein